MKISMKQVKARFGWHTKGLNFTSLKQKPLIGSMNKGTASNVSQGNCRWRWWSVMAYHQQGIFLFDPATQSAVNYNSSAGSVGKNFYSNSLLRASQNTFFTSSQRGIEYFKYVEGQADFVDSKVVLTGFNKMGEAVRLGKPLSYITDLYLSYEDYFFSLDFALLDFSDPKRSLFCLQIGRV